MLVTLALLLQTKSVTRTAQRLGVSQPSVSRALSQLRVLLSDPLLVRINGGMELTRRAEDLAAPLQEWLSSTSALLQSPEFDPAAVERRFRVASTDFGVAAVVEPALPHILSAAPGLAFDVVPFSADMMLKLASGEIDLIITGLEPDRSLAHDRFLFSESYVCVFRKGHPLTERDGEAALSLDDFLRWPQISLNVSDSEYDRIDFCLRDRAHERRVVARLPYFQAAPGLIGASDMIMTLPARYGRQLIEGMGLASAAAPVELSGFDYRLLWHERSHRDPATNWLVELLTAHCG